MTISSIFRVFAVVALTALSCAAQAHDTTRPAGSGAQAQDAEVNAHMNHLVVALPNGLTIEDPMLLVAGPSAKSVAAFMVIKNSSGNVDRLIAAEADFARSAQLHTHVMENDIAKMREVEGGFEIAAGGSHDLVRGGDHIMFMGLKSVPVPGETVNLTLTFEKAGVFTIPFIVMEAGAMQHDHK